MRSLCLFTLIIFVALTGCNNQNSTSDATSSDVEEATEQAIYDEHNSRNALDWPGVYKGTIPCADCPGIETSIALKSDGTFERSVRYLEKENGVTNDDGSFSWDESGSTVTLQSADGTAQSYQVGENVLFHLDQDGSRITGDLEENYKLWKNMTDYQLENNRWELVELMGNEISVNDNQKTPFIVFDVETARFSGNAGCNNFFGGYELMEGSRIKMGNAASTMMACPDMSIEDQFLKVLGQVDNYNVSDSTLSLNRARMAPLARFVAVEE